MNPRNCLELNHGNSYFSSISDDVLLIILLFCGPIDVEQNLKRVCSRLYAATSLSRLLWREFCILTGKVLVLDSQVISSSKSRTIDISKVTSRSNEHGLSVGQIIGTSIHTNVYREYYFRNPCVPIDFDTINEAQRHCPRLLSEEMSLLSEENMQYSGVGTVVLMPGVYAEHVVISGVVQSGEQDNVNDRIISIRAAFPTSGATIQSPNASPYGDGIAEDMPCISVSACDDDILDDLTRGICVQISYLQISHSSRRGADIWGGNTAIKVVGPGAHVIIDTCILRSDTGRGLVVTTQAVCELYSSSIIDCAATGFYLGDRGSCALISRCNIVRNGYGSRPIQLVDETFETVPAGHSGVYIESSICWVDDSLVAANSLTGLSVVRGAFVSLSGSDVTENGYSPFLLEDLFDVRGGARLNEEEVRIRGVLAEGQKMNNFTSLQGENIFKGGAIRDGGNAAMVWLRI